MASVGPERDPRTGRFLPGNKISLKHGAFSLRATGKVPSVRGVRRLRKELVDIKEKLEGVIPKLDVRKELLISQVLRTEAQLRLIEMYVDKAGMLRPERWRRGLIDLQPALANHYTTFLNIQRQALLALGLDGQDAEEILAPYEYVEKLEEQRKAQG